VLNAVDGCMPSDLGTGTTADIEEERRLLYVAMTRAKDSLHLILPQRFYTHAQRAKGDRHVYASRTRFIPREILDHFDYVSWPGSSDGRVANSTCHRSTHRYRRADAGHVALSGIRLAVGIVPTPPRTPSPATRI
jgi:DNA helicase-2/ATP-dependent DNA helicase PcrA